MSARIFPDLPIHRYSAWAPEVLEAHDMISVAYYQAVQLLRLEDGDPIRLRLHSEQLFCRFLPILTVLEREGMDGGWVENAAQVLGNLIADLEESAVAIQERCERLIFAVHC